MRYKFTSKGFYIKHKTADSRGEAIAKAVEWIDFAGEGAELTIKVLDSVN